VSVALQLNANALNCDRVHDLRSRCERGPMVRRWSFLLVLVLVTGAGAQETTYQIPFSGKPLQRVLQPSAQITCESRRVTSTGYSPRGDGYVLLSGTERRTTSATWQISLTGSQEAEVRADQIATPDRFQIIRRDPASLILVRIGQGASGGTVETLTIDPRNGSFVVGNSSVGPLWNRTGVWVGQCR